MSRNMGLSSGTKLGPYEIVSPLTGDGRFLVLNWAFESAAPLTLVENWQGEIKK